MVNMTSCPQEFRCFIERSVDHLVEKMQDSLGMPIDFTLWPWFWAFDMTYAIMFGKHLGFIEQRNDFNQMIEGFVSSVRPAALIGQVPEWCPWTLHNPLFMSLMRRLQRYPDPTRVLLGVK